MRNGANWPHSQNFYNATRVRHWGGARRPPPIGLPRAALGVAPGTPARFSGAAELSAAQTLAAMAATPPAVGFTEVGSCSAGAGVSPPGWRGSVQAMARHRDITNPWALAWWMHGRGAQPGYPEPARYREAAQLATTGMGPRGLSGVHPLAVPYVTAGERPPPPWSSQFASLSEAERADYASWWNRYYTADAPTMETAPEPVSPPPLWGEYGPFGPPAPAEPTTEPAAPPPLWGEYGPHGPPPAELAPPLEVTEEPTGAPGAEPEPEPGKPWGWIIGGTAAAGALVATVLYVASRKRPRRRRG